MGDDDGRLKKQAEDFSPAVDEALPVALALSQQVCSCFELLP